MSTPSAASPAKVRAFSSAVWAYHAAHRRDMPWRERPARMSQAQWAYRVVVSEIMLQQTQVHRVVAKFESWMKRFPDWRALAAVSTRDVIEEWSGLGYNRRALFLKRIAETLHSSQLECQLPRTFQGLRALPGIGPNTAGSILAFAFDIPYPFIETNIRSAFIHFFFPAIEAREGTRACKKISDDEIMPFIEAALKLPKNAADPREWHYALMDYGADLKKRFNNPSRRSAHHVKQSKFEGSNRELRSKILKLVMEGKITAKDLYKNLDSYPRSQIKKNVAALEREGFIRENKTPSREFRTA